MATFSKKIMGKEVGDAKVYAKPHTMSGKAVTVSDSPGSGPDHSDAGTVNMSVGNVNRRPHQQLKQLVSKCVAQVQLPKALCLEAQWHELQ